MSLYDRLETVRRTQTPTTGARLGDAPARPHAPARASLDPFAAVKAAVHQTLLDTLGPQLYDPNLGQVDLDQRIPPQLYIAVAELLAWIYRLESGQPVAATPFVTPLPESLDKR